jgi:hypothetical protein
MQSALHEFGHALGLVHEFQNPSAGEVFKEDLVLTYFKGAPNFWPDELIRSSVLDKSPDYPGVRAYDPESVMNYVFSPELFMPDKETRPGMTLSKSDKEFVASLYPRE